MHAFDKNHKSLTCDQWSEGKVLNFGAAIGFVVGIIIVYQVIYIDVSKHLPEYATLKAMGYKDRDLTLVVFISFE